MDRISDLPDLVIEKILLSMPLLDAVRTSALSKKWQYKWTTIPKISLDISLCMFLVFSNLGRGQQFNYLHMVNSILLQHTGALEEFDVFDPDFQSICTVLMRGVKKLSIMSLPSTWPSLFPPAPSLTSLEIACSGSPGQPSAIGFPNLTSLTFDKVACDPDTLTSIISSCPNLLRIVLRNLNNEGQLLNICAPKVEYLLLEGKFESLCLQGAHNLREMELHLKDMHEYSVWNMAYVIDFFHSMDRLESLRLGGCIYKVLAEAGRMTKLPRRFGELRTLKFDNVDFRDVGMLRCMLCFIHTSPNLRLLEINANPPATSALGEKLNLQAQSYEHCSFPHLEKVLIGPIFGPSNELEVIKFLLFCTPALQLMSIVLAWHGRKSKSKLLRALAQFHHASPNAMILLSSKYP